MKKITVEIESSDDVTITAESIERKWNHNLLEENKIKVKNISSNPSVSGSLPLLDEYREYVLRTGLLDRKSLQDWAGGNDR